MMDVTSAHVPQQIPKPPNEKMIHVSQCTNDRCPLQTVWQKQQYSINNPAKYNRENGEFDQQFIPFFPCPKCEGGEIAKYCSQRCFQQDWFKRHQFECSGQVPEARDSVLLSDV